MADESACCIADVKHILNQGGYNMINIRLSKFGGFKRSMDTIQWLRKKQIPFQIGCHLGESGLLSAAGRALSLLCGDAKYHDGSYDAYLLKENLTTQNVSFGYGGKAGPLNNPGLGIHVDRKKLRKQGTLLRQFHNK